MTTLNVLVTGIGGPTAQGVMKGLIEHSNVRIIGTDRREVTAGLIYCNQTYTIPKVSDHNAYKDAIKEIVDKEKIDAIFPSLHEEINLYSSFRYDIHAKVALPESEIFDVLMDKEKVYVYLSEHDLQTYVPKYVGFTQTFKLPDIIENFFPNDDYVVAKQVNGHGSIGFAILTNRGKYLDALKKGKNKIINKDDYFDIHVNERRMVMEYLAGKEYSVDIFMHKGKVITVVPRERTGVSSGIVLDGTVVKNEALIYAASLISETLIDSGFMNLQFIESEDGYKLTDVNPRFCGSHVMCLGANVNFPYLFLQYNILDEFTTVQPKWNTRMIRYRDQFFVNNDAVD